MKCLYINPTVQQCNNCTFDDCIRDEKQDKTDYMREWFRNHPDKRRTNANRYRRSHPEQVKKDNDKYYASVKDTEKYKEKRHEYYLLRKGTPEYKAYKKENNRRYYQRKKAERVS